MAGHSKWKNIQHRKGRQDAKKGKIFHKLAREIYVAAREGDPDPDTNHKLKIAINKAKAENMPNENIDRAINKAAGGSDGQDYESMLYEGYAAGGVAVLVDVLTDNRNRTAADVRHLFSKHGGNLGEAGSVAWMFSRQGLIVLERETTDINEEDLLLLALESGADDFAANEETIEIITEPQAVESVREALEAEGLTIDSAEVTFLPSTQVTVNTEGEDKLEQLLEQLEDHDDVQMVYTNAASEGEK